MRADPLQSSSPSACIQTTSTKRHVQTGRTVGGDPSCYDNQLRGRPAPRGVAHPCPVLVAENGMREENSPSRATKDRCYVARRDRARTAAARPSSGRDAARTGLTGAEATAACRWTTSESTGAPPRLELQTWGHPTRI